MRILLTSVFAALVAMIAPVLRAGDLEKPYQLMAGDKPLDIGGIGYAAPCMGDFDLDGKRDLLIGQFTQGKMRIFLNQGTDAQPKFGEDYVWFMDGADTGRVPTG